MIRYAITDVSRLFLSPFERKKALTASVKRWAECGIEYVQLREKSLDAGELFSSAEELMKEIRRVGGRTRLLVNGRPDVAAAAGCDGVHLTARTGELTPAQVREIFARVGRLEPVISVSCHTVMEVRQKRDASLLLFGPVFEKVVGDAPVAPGLGLALLREAVKAAGTLPVVALGGVTATNTPACLQAGAAGVAGIRLFG